MLHSLSMVIMLALFSDPNLMFAVLFIQKRALKIRTAAHYAKLHMIRNTSISSLMNILPFHVL
jgi:hypothetical protein